MLTLVFCSGPIASNGWALLGELSKWVPVSQQRVLNVTEVCNPSSLLSWALLLHLLMADINLYFALPNECGQAGDNLEVLVRGEEGETVDLTFSRLEETKFTSPVVVSATIPQGKETVLMTTPQAPSKH